MIFKVNQDSWRYFVIYQKDVYALYRMNVKIFYGENDKENHFFLNQFHMESPEDLHQFLASEPAASSFSWIQLYTSQKTFEGLLKNVKNQNIREITILDHSHHQHLHIEKLDISLSWLQKLRALQAHMMENKKHYPLYWTSRLSTHYQMHCALSKTPSIENIEKIAQHYGIQISFHAYSALFAKIIQHDLSHSNRESSVLYQESATGSMPAKKSLPVVKKKFYLFVFIDSLLKINHYGIQDSAIIFQRFLALPPHDAMLDQLKQSILETFHHCDRLKERVPLDPSSPPLQPEKDRFFSKEREKILQDKDEEEMDIQKNHIQETNLKDPKIFLESISKNITFFLENKGLLQNMALLKTHFPQARFFVPSSHSKNLDEKDCKAQDQGNFHTWIIARAIQENPMTTKSSFSFGYFILEEIQNRLKEIFFFLEKFSRKNLSSFPFQSTSFFTEPFEKKEKHHVLTRSSYFFSNFSWNLIKPLASLFKSSSFQGHAENFSAKKQKSSKKSWISKIFFSWIFLVEAFLILFILDRHQKIKTFEGEKKQKNFSETSILQKKDSFFHPIKTKDQEALSKLFQQSQHDEKEIFSLIHNLPSMLGHHYALRKIHIDQRTIQMDLYPFSENLDKDLSEASGKIHQARHVRIEDPSQRLLKEIPQHLKNAHIRIQDNGHVFIDGESPLSNKSPDTS